MSQTSYCTFAIEEGLLSKKQNKYLVSTLKASVIKGVNENTNAQQVVYTFYCSSRSWEIEMQEIIDIMDANPESCGGLAQADNDGPSTNITEYGDAEGCGVVVNIEYKW